MGARAGNRWSVCRWKLQAQTGRGCRRGLKHSAGRAAPPCPRDLVRGLRPEEAVLRPVCCATRRRLAHRLLGASVLAWDSEASPALGLGCRRGRAAGAEPALALPPPRPPPREPVPPEPLPQRQALTLRRAGA